MTRLKKNELDTLVKATSKKLRTGGLQAQVKLRQTLLEKHGLDGIWTLLQCDSPKWTAEIHPVGAEGSPWQNADGEPGEILVSALGALAAKLPLTVAQLRTASHVAVAKHAPQKKSPDLGGWFLVAAVPTDNGPMLWVAGPPAADPETRLDGWDLPAELAELYAVHNGIGYLCDDYGWTGFDPGVQPALLLTSPERCADHPPQDLLRLTRGTGEAGDGGWCFLRRSTTSALQIVELEDKFGTLGAPIDRGFWWFLDRYLVRDPKTELPYAESF